MRTSLKTVHRHLRLNSKCLLFGGAIAWLVICQRPGQGGFWRRVDHPQVRSVDDRVLRRRAFAHVLMASTREEKIMIFVTISAMNCLL